MNKEAQINEWEAFKNTFKNALKDFFIGVVPEIDDFKPITGILKPSKKREVTLVIKNIAENCERFKIGVTGNRNNRIEANEYRENYDCVRLIYQSTSKKRIALYEVELIKKIKKLYPSKIDNISETEATHLSDVDKSFVIYVVYSTAE